MTKFFNTKSEISEIIKIAHKLIDKYGDNIDDAQDCEKLLDMAHKIGGQSISEDRFPNSNLMSSLVNLLADQNINFAVIGAAAVSVYGLVRHTDDIDVLVSDMPDVSDRDYAERFGFYRARSQTGTVMSIDHRKTGYVELLKVNNSLYEYAINNSIIKPLLGFNVPVVPPDALIALKVRAMVDNPSRENKDSMDVISIHRNNEIDFSNVKSLLTDKEVSKLKEIIPNI